MARFARIKGDWLLRGWSNLQWSLVNWRKGDHRKLTQRGFYVVGACDGTTDFDSIAFLPHHQACLDTLIAEGIAEACQEGDAIAAYQRYRRADNPWLMGVHWSVTGRCNLKCLHCYMEAPSKRYGQLSLSDTLKVIDQFEQANVHQISLTGGEPFMRKDLLQIMASLLEKRIWISEIYTNGLLISRRTLEEIKDLGFWPNFQISFDGYGCHDYMRGCKGVEAKVLNSIRMVRSAGFRVVVATSIDQMSKGHMVATYEILKKLNIQSWRIAPPQEIGNWRDTRTQLSFDEQARIYEPLLGRWLADAKPFDIQLGGFFNHPGGENPAQPTSIRHSPEQYDCGACREKPYLLPDGLLLPCPGYSDTQLQGQMPNILEVGLVKAWTRSPLRSIVEIKKEDLLAQNAECCRCELFESCGMGCRAVAVAKTGSLTAKDPIACEISKNGYKKQFHELARATQLNLTA